MTANQGQRRRQKLAAKQKLAADRAGAAKSSCIAAVKQAWPSSTASDEARLLSAITIACIQKNFTATPDGFQILPTAKSVINRAIQGTKIQSAPHGKKLQDFMQLALLSRAFARSTADKTYAVDMAAVLPNATQHIKSLLPSVNWSRAAPTAAPTPASTYLPSSSQQQNSQFSFPVQKPDANQPVPCLPASCSEVPPTSSAPFLLKASLALFGFQAAGNYVGLPCYGTTASPFLPAAPHPVPITSAPATDLPANAPMFGSNLSICSAPFQTGPLAAQQP